MDLRYIRPDGKTEAEWFRLETCKAHAVEDAKKFNQPVLIQRKKVRGYRKGIYTNIIYDFEWQKDLTDWQNYMKVFPSSKTHPYIKKLRSKRKGKTSKYYKI